MKRSLLFALALLCLATPLLAQPAQEAKAGSELNELTATIQAELEVHGERVLGQDAYHWSTRLVGISDCRAEFSVRVSNNVGEPTARTESVTFSLGALDRTGIDVNKKWLELPCLARQNCI